MIAAPEQADQHFLLHSVTWQGYETLLREVGDRHLRMTYDDGDLELTTLSLGHENIGSHAACFGGIVVLGNLFLQFDLPRGVLAILCLVKLKSHDFSYGDATFRHSPKAKMRVTSAP